MFPPCQMEQVFLTHHVSVADSGHGNKRPPEAERDRVEVVVRIRLDPLRVINWKDDHDDGVGDHGDDHDGSAPRNKLII